MRNVTSSCCDNANSWESTFKQVGFTVRPQMNVEQAVYRAKTLKSEKNI